MGLFTALAPLLAHGVVTIRAEKLEDGRVKVTLVQVTEKEGDVGIPPMRETATAEELDRSLEEALPKLAEHRAGAVQTVLDQAKAAMTEAATEEKRKADEKAAAARSSKKPATVKASGTKPVQKFSLDTPDKGGEGGSEAPGDPEDDESTAPEGGGGSQAPAPPADSKPAEEDLFA